MKLKILALSCAFAPLAFSSSLSISKPTLARISPPAIHIAAPSWVLISYQSGQVIAGKNINEKRPVASLTKLMTSYVTSQAIEAGKINLKDPVHVSVKAWRTGGSKSFIKEGDTVSVENLLKGLIIQSGNDTAVSLAEHIAGSESAFTQLMNHTANSLGMQNSHFTSASGMPAPNQYSSALDIAILSRALIAHYPKEYHWYKIKSFTYNGIKQYNRNRLLWRDTNVDGLKTGYTKAAGYCLTASANHHGERYIAVVLGAASVQARENEAQKLLTYANRFYTTKQLFAKGEPVQKISIKGAARHKLIATVSNALYVTAPKSQLDKVHAHLSLKPNLTLPIKAGSNIGKIVVEVGKKTIETRPAIAQKTVKKAGVWERASHWVKSLF